MRETRLSEAQRPEWIWVTGIDTCATEESNGLMIGWRRPHLWAEWGNYRSCRFCGAQQMRTDAGRAALAESSESEARGE